MGCASSKEAETDSTVLKEIQFLATIREVTDSLSKPYNAEEADTRILDVIENELKVRFLDASIHSLTSIRERVRSRDFPVI